MFHLLFTLLYSQLGSLSLDSFSSFSLTIPDSWHCLRSTVDKLPQILECFPSTCLNVYVTTLLPLSSQKEREMSLIPSIHEVTRGESPFFFAMELLNALNVQLHFFEVISYLTTNISPMTFCLLGLYSLKTLGSIPQFSVPACFLPLLLAGPGASL